MAINNFQRQQNNDYIALKTMQDGEIEHFCFLSMSVDIRIPELHTPSTDRNLQAVDLRWYIQPC